MEILQKNRLIYQRLPEPCEQLIVLLTGARQTGKTTTARSRYPGLSYFNLDAAEYRYELGEISTFKWGKTIGNAVLDEIQKQPLLLDKM